jgi:hypothetical protein
MQSIKFIYVLLTALVFAACGENAPQKASEPAVNADSLSMVMTLRTFYKWYGETGEQLITKINFADEKGPHPVLNEQLLADYLAEFVKSGAVSTAFVEDETKFYRACAELWKTENSGEVISGWSLDRYYCQQDGDVTEFLTAPIGYKMMGDRATVQLLLKPDGPNQGPRNFEMKKENGQWLIAKIGCDSGVKY